MASGILASPLVTYSAESELIHDADYYILKAQHGEQWAADNKAVDAKLEAFMKTNNGKPPNILYVLVDDMGFGDMGIPELNAIRGYETPNINDFADQGMRFARMYTEPSCTPTRVAFMTGRQPHRNGMGDTAVDIAGFGLAGKEITLAEVLSEAGYNTVHIGKWHMGDIAEAWPNNQGFDYAAFPVHQQGQLTVFSRQSHEANQAIGADYSQFDDRWVLDRSFRPVAGAMVTGLEARAGEMAREVHMQTGEEWTQQKYVEMNERYLRQTLEQLDDLVAVDPGRRRQRHRRCGGDDVDGTPPQRLGVADDRHRRAGGGQIVDGLVVPAVVGVLLVVAHPRSSLLTASPRCVSNLPVSAPATFDGTSAATSPPYCAISRTKRLLRNARSERHGT